MAKPKFDFEDLVRIKQDADFKYNNRRSRAAGIINDIYESSQYGDYVYEVEFSDSCGGYDLVRQEDLETKE